MPTSRVHKRKARSGIEGAIKSLRETLKHAQREDWPRAISSLVAGGKTISQVGVGLRQARDSRPRYRMVDPHQIVPLHRIKRYDDLDELIWRMKHFGWEGRRILVEEIGWEGHRYQAWTATHRLAAARQLGILVPVLTVHLGKWERRYGHIDDLAIDMVNLDEEKYAALMKAGDILAANIMHEEIQMNLSGDEQDCLG
jgi:hypothetical protein